MESRVELAVQNKKQGMNCAQAVACAFADKVDMSLEDIFCVLEGFGLGMGGMQGTCGAVSGAVAIASLLNSKGPDFTQNKAATYKITKEIVKRFEEKNQSSICKELKGVETGTVLRICPGCISDAVGILEDVIKDFDL